VGTHSTAHRRRFLHTRPLSEPLLGEHEKFGYPDKTPTTFPSTTAIPKDFLRLALPPILPPIYYFEHFEHTLKNNDTYKKLSSTAPATKRFVPLTRDTSNIHWEKSLPTAPIPQIPLYWINLKRSKTRGENMVQQLRELQWKSATRIEAFDGKVNGGAKTHEEDKDNYNELSKLIHVDKINIKSLPCYDAFCSPSQLATLLSHLRALRQAWADGHEYALVAEDDVDFILYDESILLQMVKRLPKLWGSLQLYTGNADLLEMLFNEYPAMGFASRNSLVHHPWSSACV
jgi:hypothetical protein